VQSSNSVSLLYDVLDAALEITGAQMGNVQLLDRGALKIVAQRGFHAPFLEFFAEMRDGPAACGEAMRRGERVVVEDITSSPIFEGTRALEVLVEAGVRAVQSTPVVDRSGALIGLFSTHFREAHRPDPRELRLLDLLARQAGAFIERDDARAALTAKERQLARITESVGSPIAQCDRDLRYVFANEAYARLIRLPLEQIVGRPIVDVIGAEAFETIRPSVERVLRGERVEYETPINYPGMGQRYLHAVYVPDTNAQGQVVGWFAALADITERKRIEEELRATEEALRAASRHKDEFIAVLGHELRNPLSVIQNGVEMLRRPDLAGRTPEVLGMLDRQVGHMVRLVDDLLDLSRVARGSIDLRHERIDLADVLNKAVENSRALIESQGHTVTITFPPQPVYLAGDSDRLVQAVGNLLSNACKFMDKGGRIELTAESANQAALIRVRDHGIGIATGDARRIFEMFAQLDSSMQRGNGLGIGLTLVKGIVEKHGGTVDVHSGGSGQGSEFVVRLPALAGETTEVLSEMTESEEVVQRDVLIVDDNRDSAQTLAELLAAYGHKTHVVHDGMEALEAAERLHPEVVLLDIGLPKLDGYDACRRIRSQPWGGKMVLVALTGYGQEKDARRAEQAGFNYHLVKPVKFSALGRVLAAVQTEARA